MKKTITIIIVVLVIAAAGVGGFFYFKKNQTVHNNDNAIGNTAGNLINGGLFCEYNDKIYFANPDDYNKLYVKIYNVFSNWIGNRDSSIFLRL